MFNAWLAFLYALAGGVVGEGLLIFEQMRTLPREEFRDQVGGLLYWVGVVGLILIGGVIAVIYQNQGSVMLNSVIAANIGIAPAIAADRYLKNATAGAPGSSS